MVPFRTKHKYFTIMEKTQNFKQFTIPGDENSPYEITLSDDEENFLPTEHWLKANGGNDKFFYFRLINNDTLEIIEFPSAHPDGIPTIGKRILSKYSMSR